MMGNWSPAEGLETSPDFVKRYRFDLEVFKSSTGPLVRKDYRGARSACRRESLALATIGSRAHAPRLISVDAKRKVILKTFVQGPTLREVLVASGARILSRQTTGDEELSRLEGTERLTAVWQRGREVLLALDRDRSLSMAMGRL